MIKLNVIYNQETGAILKAVSSSNSATLNSNMETGDSFIETELEDISNLFDYVVIDGTLVKRGKSQDEQWSDIRKLRDQYLLACDWTQLPDVPEATKELWMAYRQALRDVTDQDDPFNIEWPVAP